MENAGDFGVTVDVVMAMYLSGARGMPVTLTSEEVEMLMCGSSLVEVVGEVMVTFFVDVGNDEDDALCGR